MTVDTTTSLTLLVFLRALHRSIDVVLCQEHEMLPERVERCRGQLSYLGWLASVTPALLGPKGWPSCGTAVLPRRHLNLVCITENIDAGRVAATPLRDAQLGDLELVSGYLNCVGGLAGNVGTIQAVGDHLD